MGKQQNYAKKTDKSSEHSNGKSRKTDPNSASSQRAVNYNNFNKNTNNNNNANKKGSQPTDADITILKVKRGNKINISKLILSKDIDEGYDAWLKIRANEAISSYGPIGGELKGIAYEYEHQLPEVPIATGNEFNKKIQLQEYFRRKDKYEDELKTVKLHRVKIIEEVFKKLDEELLESVHNSISQFLNQPDIND